MTTILGLTGGIATGKSTVSKMFTEKNIMVIDTDKIARHVLQKGTPGYFEVIEAFSEDILLTDKEINRKLLGRLIFMNKAKRETLNNIVHPKVLDICFQEIEKQKELHKKLVVLDVPLLYESGFDQYCDIVLCVYTTKERQLKRLMDRDLIDEEYAKMKIHAQMSIEEKVVKADYVINNSNSILDTKRQFNDILKQLEGED